MKNKIILFLIICVIFCLAFSFRSVVYNHSKSLYEQHQYNRAILGFKYLILLDPDNTDYRYYFIKVLSELSPTYENQKIMYSFSIGQKDDSARYEAIQKVREWKSSVLKNTGRNFIEQAPFNSQILRWNKESFPLKVFIDFNSMKDLPDYYRSSVNLALNQWEKSVDFISFVNATSKSDAQILILFEPLPKDVCQGNKCLYVAAFTEPKFNGHILKQMVITVYSENGGGQFCSDKEIYNSVLHELGHALGIMGHSYSTDDLMYQTTKNNNSMWSKYRSEFQYINGTDVNTIKLLYMLAPDITNKPISDLSDLIYAPIILGSSEERAERKLKEAQIYIKNSPNIPGGYVDMAQAYIDLMDFNKALYSLNKAIDLAKTEEDRFVIYHTYAIAYFKLEKFDFALKYAELAKNIRNTSELDEFISLIKNRGAR